jgi:hypothetical protein
MILLLVLVIITTIAATTTTTTSAFQLTRNPKSTILPIHHNYRITHITTRTTTTTTTTTVVAIVPPKEIDMSINHKEEYSSLRAFQGNVTDLQLPEPPTDVEPIYSNNNNNNNNKGKYDMTTTTTTNPSVRFWKVPARFNYVVPSTTKIQLHRDVNGKDFNHATNGTGWFTNHPICYVVNGRTTRPAYRLHTNGFELLTNPTNDDDNNSSIEMQSKPQPVQQLTTNIDFHNRDIVMDVYYPHCQQILQQHLGPNVRVWAFDHNVRQQQEPHPSESSSVPVQQQYPVSSTDDDDVHQNETATTKTTTTMTTNNTVSGTTTVVQKPIGLVHGDYTTTSAPRRLQLLGESPKINDIWYDRFIQMRNCSSTTGSSSSNNSCNNDPPPTSLLDPHMVQECLTSTEKDQRPKRRYAFINVWRNIDVHNPVMALPLGCVDAQTHCMKDDFRILELHYTDRIGENYLSCHPPDHHPDVENDINTNESKRAPQRQHQWVYFPHMDYHEALLIKQWDSHGTDLVESSSSESNNTIAEEEEYISTLSLHSAFIDPTTPNNAPPRQSIEVRCVAIWDSTC